MARAEVVRSVNDDVAVSGEIKEFGFVNEVPDGFDRNVGIDGVQGEGCALRLVHADALGRVQNLARQIGKIHGVGVGNRERGHAAFNKRQGCGTAHAARADDEHAAGGDARLPLRADFLQKNVTAVAIVGHYFFSVSVVFLL